jgi:hypothetical protein
MDCRLLKILEKRSRKGNIGKEKEKRHDDCQGKKANVLFRLA